jgi:hypothetical protein
MLNGGMVRILMREKKAKPKSPYKSALNNIILYAGAFFLLWLILQKALFGLVNNHRIRTYQRAGDVKSSSIRLKIEKFSILSTLNRFPQKAQTKLSCLLSLPHLGHLLAATADIVV